MNTQISADIDLALRKHVERSVRPVRAGKCKKLTMREELFSHLTTIYCEEFERRADEQAAMQAALERFGEPATLTAELNSSVSWIERLDYWEDVLDRKVHYLFAVRTDESWLRFALRWAVVLGFLNAFFLTLLLSVASVQSRIGDTSGFFAAWLCATLLTVAQPAAILGIRGVYIALTRRQTAVRWFAAILQAFAWTAFEVIVLFAFWWSIIGSSPTNNTQMIFVMNSFFIGLPPFLLFGGWLCTLAKWNQDKHAVWTTLMIDE